MNTKNYPSLLSLLILLTSPLMAGTITNIAISNPSFDADVLAQGSFQNPISSWTTTGNNVGIINRGPNVYTAGGSATGQNVAFTNGGSLSQTLSSNYTANTLYIMNTDFGVVNGAWTGAGYSTEILADGITVGSRTQDLNQGGTYDTGYTPWVVSASMSSSSFIHQSGTSVTPGQALGVRISGLEAGKQLDIDNVRLTAISGSAINQIPVTNPSFQDQVLTNGYNAVNPSGWTYQQGNFDMLKGEIAGINQPAGDQYAISFGNTTSSIFQNPTTITEGSTYVAAVMVGDRGASFNMPDFELQMYADATLAATGFSEDFQYIQDGQFSLVYTYFTATAGMDGQDLFLTLVNENTGNNGQALWDDVVLYEVTAIPEPTTYAFLTAMACLGLVWLRRRI